MLMLVLTLIANPKSRTLSEAMANSLSAEIGSTQLVWLGDGCACDIALPENLSSADARRITESATMDAPVDFAIQLNEKRRKQVLIADMDSTMIEQECIDELAEEVGLREEVSAITAKAMNGELDFEASVNERVALLEGISTNVAEKIISNRIDFASGGRTLVQTMKANGAYTALVSGGFTSFTQPIAKTLGFDENRANVLLEDDGKLTGKVQMPILGADAKVVALNEIATQKNLTANDFIAVGDGANDIPMLQIAGTGVALHAKPSVAQQTEISINHGDLTALLYLQGYSEADFTDG
ncbi:MAG: phosphoserine phosphatase SerB [Pseudomonadota bacterium]